MAKRGSIIAALKTALEAVTKSGDVVFSKVTTIPIPIDKLSKANTPACIIVPGDMPLVPLTSENYTTGSSAQSADGWQVALIIYNPPSTIQTESEFANFDNNYVEPIFEALINTNLSLSYVVNIYAQAINLYRFQQNGAYIGEIILGIKYDFSKSSY